MQAIRLSSPRPLGRQAFLSTFIPLLTAALGCCLEASALAAAKPAATVEAAPTKEQLAFFEKNIRPVLVSKCYKCHSAESEKVKGGLLLDTREGARMGGDTGHAVVPGNLEESLLIKAVRWETKDLEMPPKEKLPAEVIANFEKWVQMGAPDPREGAKTAIKKPSLEEGRSFWAFQAPKPVTPPKVKDTKWASTDVDRFVLASLEAKGLKPVADAGKHTLIRRVYFDLIGLPPSPEEVEAFVNDKDPKALEKVVDRLLASPQFGERWGRHWLDVARYAESTGKERNYAFTQAWRYRDYVIGSFNTDKPYDQFIREQVAGDLLPAKTVAQRNEQLVATGFLALGPKGLNERNREQFVMDNVDEQIDVTTRAVMAVTVSCARCHDHKFDPIMMSDYYALAGIFKSSEIYYGVGGGTAGKNRQPSKLIPAAKEGDLAKLNRAPEKAASVSAPAGEAAASKGTLTAEQRAMIERMTERSPKAKERLAMLTDEQKLALLERFKGGTPGKPTLPAAKGKPQQGKYAKAEVEVKDEADDADRIIMGVLDGHVADCPVYLRGELQDKGPVISRGFPQVFAKPGATSKLPGNESGRLELAGWLSSPENPLTARVMANRVWQHLFGDGIVSSADNFGATGERPTHPELLDYLANRFVDGGWSVKKLVREVVLSHAYRLGDSYDAKNFAADPDNNLLWRANQRRLDAESIRDAVLAVGGQIDLKPPQGSPLSSMSDTDLGRTRSFSTKTDSRHRSVYLPIVRDMVPDVLDLFDFAEPSLVVANRDVTNVPSQALFMLNSPFIYDNSVSLAKHVLDATTDDRKRITLAYLTALSRSPTEAEISRAEQFIQQQPAGQKGATQATWATFCQALMASAEFRYLK